MEQFNLFNKKELKVTRKRLRNKSTPAETTLWYYVKNSKLQGKKFRRQYSASKYILDFYCPEQKLAIELDGNQHRSDRVYDNDKERTVYLNSLGIRVLRFENKLIFSNINEVLNTIVNNFH